MAAVSVVFNAPVTLRQAKFYTFHNSLTWGKKVGISGSITTALISWVSRVNFLPLRLVTSQFRSKDLAIRSLITIRGTGPVNSISISHIDIGNLEMGFSFAVYLNAYGEHLF